MLRLFLLLLHSPALYVAAVTKKCRPKAMCYDSSACQLLVKGASRRV